MPAFSVRAATLAEALQALLESAVATAGDADPHGARLNASAARFDGVASALEQDLLTLARSKPSRQLPLPNRLLRTLADCESQPKLSGAKRARIR